MKFKNYITAIVVTLMALFSSYLMAANTMPQSKVSNKELTKAARDAYIFSYPLVMHYRTMYRQAVSGVGFGRTIHI